MGVIVGRSGENWRVDIGSAHTATLDGLAFEGATKRNRPNLKASCSFYIATCGLQRNGLDIVRLAPWFMLAYLWHTKTWNRSSSVSTHRRGRLKGSENSKEAFLRIAVSKCHDCMPPFTLSHCHFAHISGRYRLLDPQHFLLPFLGSRFPLESAAGTNGRVWITTKEPRQVIAIARCIEAVDPDGGGMDESAVKKFLSTLDV